MKRTEFKHIVDTIFTSLEQHTYDYWAKQEYPYVYEEEVNHLTVQVEISLLELSETRVHVAVTLFAGCYAGFRLPWDPLRPITRTIIAVNVSNSDETG